MKEKSALWWTVCILLGIWQLPQFLVGLIMLPFLGKLELVATRHFSFCFKGEKMQGGISLGPLVYVSKNLSTKPECVAHELDGHTVQSKILGPLYIFTVGLFSLLHATFHNSKKSCYYNYWTESWANKIAGLYTDEYCILRFKK